jgi:hypothetical protein
MKQKPYKASSVKPVYSFLKSLNGGVNPTSLDFLIDRPVVLTFLETHSLTTQRTMMFVIRNVAKDFQRADILELWKKNIEDAEAGKGRPTQEKSEAQERAYAKLETDKGGDAWDTIMKRMEEHNKTANAGDLDYVVPNLYTLFPPRRNLDYTEMKINDDIPISEWDKLSKEFNYLCGEQFIFNRYKTDGVYRQQIFDVPDDLLTVLERWIKATGKKDGDYLLTKTSRYSNIGDKLRSDDITDVLHRVFDKGISTQMLRHMFVDKYNTPEREKVIHEMLGDAEKMAHSIGTQQGVYVKKP